jgi:hypothetical protein
MIDKPPPKFAIGQRVRVVLNERNKTPHSGAVRRMVWHYKDQRYYFFLEEHGKMISKQYRDDDLE